MEVESSKRGQRLTKKLPGNDGQRDDPAEELTSDDGENLWEKTSHVGA